MYCSVVSLKTYGPRGSPSGKPPRRLFRKQKEAGQEEREEKKPEEHEYQSDDHSSMTWVKTLCV